MTRILITSALPYINGIKHLGNFAGSMLPADVLARYWRQDGFETLFICATDEHGTPAELAAEAAGMDVASYCAQQYEIQRDIYARFAMSFDHFGRSSGHRNRALTQHIFNQLDAHGYIYAQELQQMYARADRRFLPDRYIVGTCPHCGYTAARGDQCEDCTRQLDPAELLQPRSALSGSTDLELRPSQHLFLRQSALVEDLTAWLKTASPGWPHLVTSIIWKWLQEGVRDRCITRDLTWGIPVPKPGFEDKVFYVWFDAPIAYMAATWDWADLDPGARDWRAWWQTADDVEYIQVMGKDNVPFHGITFPCSLLGTGAPWHLVDFIKGLNWLNFSGGKFSTSQRRGIFMDDALALLHADYWRWWLVANAPENHDTDFTFDRFAEGVNHDLADTFGNFVNRILKFVANRFGGRVPDGGVPDAAERRLHREVDRALADLRRQHRACELRRAAEAVRTIWRTGNAYVTERAPWKLAASDPASCAMVVRTSVNLVHLSACCAWPFIPGKAAEVLHGLGRTEHPPRLPADAAEALTAIPAGTAVTVPPLTFQKLSAAWVAEQRARFEDRREAAVD